MNLRAEPEYTVRIQGIVQFVLIVMYLPFRRVDP